MSDQEPVRGWQIACLASYLGLASICAGYFVYSLWSSEPATCVIPAPKCVDITTPTLQNAYPNSLNLGTAAKIEFVGCQFPSDTQVRVNGATHSYTVEDANHIGVQFSTSDVATIGSSAITFWHGKDEIANGFLVVNAPRFQWRLLGLRPCSISQESQLLLLIIFMGTLASSIYACKSLADYLGDRKLGEQWLLYYLIQPLEGGGVAILFYVLVRAGFLTSSGVDVKSVNQFGMCAIAGLAGAFSDTAFMKLREVFQTLFKPQDDRGGKISPLKIVTTTLAAGQVGVEYKGALEASDGVPPRKWSVNPQLPAGLELNPDTGAITGTPTAASTLAKYKFTVTDSANPPASSTVELTLEVAP
jgi:hypothetical protein